MLLKQLFDQDTWTYTYRLADPDSREAIIIDPVVERVDRDLTLIAEMGLELVYTLDTHVHADHVTGSGELGKRTGALSGVAAVAKVTCVDRNLEHGDVLHFGRYALEVRSTPGHTDGCLTFVVEANGQTLAFTGDALFIRGCGRTDFQQGDAATLYRSVHGQIFSLPDDTLIYPGHDYRGHTVSTVTEEKAHNPRLKTDIAEAGFVAIMDGLNLSRPKRIHEALPANLGCGLAPQVGPDKAADSAVKQLSADRLDDFSGGLVVDVRSREEFQGELGHLPNAVLAPLTELQQQAAAWQRDVPVLLVCHSGGRSSQGCSMLSEMGFTDVTNLSGGMMAWRELSGVTR
jgi:glyoxylase-like metal-dependent hydrolase (beta-lactamase superfamily II)/rhodanese-related sulfurtransferase